MYRPRIIPILLLQNGGVVKTRKFDKPVYVGDPINTVKIFNSKLADELMIIDIGCGRNNEPIKFNLLKEMAGEAFMPLSYSGGIKTHRDIETILHNGIEKVCINTAALDQKLLTDFCRVFGSSTIASFIDIKKNIWGSNNIYTHSGTKPLKKTVLDQIKYLEDCGVGEIVIQDINRDGTKAGLNLDVLTNVLESTRLPVIIAGGAKDYNDLLAALKLGAAGVAAGSLFVFTGSHNAVLINFPDEKFRTTNVNKH